MTNQELRKRIGKAARELAMECVNGTAPEMGRYWLEWGDYKCALGHVYRRAKPRTYPALTERLLWPASLARVPARDIVGHANDDDATGHADRMSRLVFPLLAFADEVEATP